MSRHVPPVQGARFGDDWWQRGVIYQVYARSFADSGGDGVGDLDRIIDHLDHLGPDGLGIDAIWLSPIYPSPGLDLGYDVSDHERVDPLFGSEDDFDRLVAEAHRRGIRVVLDLVMNHTSDAHRWFESSRAGRDGPHAEWYLWRDPAGRATPAAEQLGLVLRRRRLGVGAPSGPALSPRDVRRRDLLGGLIHAYYGAAA
jgi:glycosidase